MKGSISLMLEENCDLPGMDEDDNDADLKDENSNS